MKARDVEPVDRPDGCRCGRPTRDGAFVCTTCQTRISTALGQVPDMVRRLNADRERLRGIDYATLGGSTGGDKTPLLVINLAAITARDQLRRLLRSLVVTSLQARLVTPNLEQPTSIPPRGDLPAMATWLLWRVPSMPWHAEFTSAADDLVHAVDHARDVTTPRPPRQDLGHCELEVGRVQGQEGEVVPVLCGGRVWATAGQPIAECDRCHAAIEAQPRRDRLIRALDDRLCTAAEIAHLSTYLGFNRDRERVRLLVSQWHSRRNSRMPQRAEDANGRPRFRFGDAYRLLVESEHRTHHEGATR
jgi:hypothetical protein